MADTTLDLLNQTQIELLQKYDGALNRFNEMVGYFKDGKAIEAINADMLDGFEASQNPSSEQIPVLNTSGQLRLPFNQIPILVDNQDLMSRIFYVDAENGDDSNDGTAGAPFASLKKAIDSVPTGGIGTIYLKPGQTFTLTEDITIVNKTIVLRNPGPYTDPNPVITSQEYILNRNGTDYDAIYCFNMNSGTIVFEGGFPDDGIEIIVPTHSGSNLPDPVLRGLVVLKHHSHGIGCVAAHYSSITLNKDFRFVDCYNWNNRFLGVVFQLVNTAINVNDESSILIDVVQSPLMLEINWIRDLQDNTGTGKTLRDLIAGLVSDDYGFYKNVVGNL